MIQDESVQNLRRKTIKIVNTLEFCEQLTTRKGVTHDESHSYSGKSGLKLHEMWNSHSNVCDQKLECTADLWQIAPLIWQLGH